MSQLNALELAMGVISERGARLKRLKRALVLIDTEAVKSARATVEQQRATLKTIADIAGTALIEDRSFSVVQTRRRRRMERFLSTTEREKIARV